MNDLRTAAQQALEALKDYKRSDDDRVSITMGILQAALAEPVQEPVAWRTFDGEGGYDYWAYEDNENYHEEYVKRNGEKYASWVEPLYTAPPQRKPLTDEEIRDLWSWAMTAEAERTATTQQHAFARAIERAHGIEK